MFSVCLLYSHYDLFFFKLPNKKQYILHAFIQPRFQAAFFNERIITQQSILFLTSFLKENKVMTNLKHQLKNHIKTLSGFMYKL